MMFPKHNYIRSKKLLEAARQIPCQHCGVDDGTVVAAHTNWGGGKAMRIKADDNLIASLCFTCHSQLDQGTSMTKAERMAMWEAAHKNTINRLILFGLWPDDVPNPIRVFTHSKD